MFSIECVLSIVNSEARLDRGAAHWTRHQRAAAPAGASVSTIPVSRISSMRAINHVINHGTNERAGFQDFARGCSGNRTTWCQGHEIRINRYSRQSFLSGPQTRRQMVEGIYETSEKPRPACYLSLTILISCSLSPQFT